MTALTDEQMEVVREIAVREAPSCTCHEGYTKRDLVDPECRRHDAIELIEYAILAALADKRLSRRDEWLPIETAPRDGTGVIVFDGAAVGEANYHGDDHNEWRWAGNHPTDHWGNQIYPVLWQPLPPPPVGQMITDHQKVLRCAQLMGYDIDAGRLDCVICAEPNPQWPRNVYSWFKYAPLHDKAQALDLVIKLRLEVGYGIGGENLWQASYFEGDYLAHCVNDADLLRAIVECAAKVGG